jgi:hypothetical protein
MGVNDTGVKFPGFVGGSHKSRSLFFDQQRSVNLYPQISKSGTSKNIAALFGTPGKTLWANFPDGGFGGGIRGALKVNANLALIVSGNQLYSVDANGNILATTAIDILDTPAIMATNGTQTMIVTGFFGYIHTAGSNVVFSLAGVEPDFVGADTVAFIDGYFVWNKPGTGQYQISSLYGWPVDPLDFATAEGSPDLLLSVLVDHREVWLFGEDSTEVHYNNGNTLTFPFSRIDGAFIEQGIAAKFSAAKMNNSVYWLSSNRDGQGMVQRAVGYQPQRISTHDVEFAIAGYAKNSRIDDARAYTYQQEGHFFYVLNFPSANATWVFDATTEEWHERAWLDPVNGGMNRDRGNCQIAFANKILVGDWENGNMYVVDQDVYTDNNNPMPAIRQTPYISDGDRWIFFDRMFVDLDVGVGTTSGAGSDPQAVLDWSDDAGKTWVGNRMASIGRLGDRKIRCNFRRLGKSKARIFRFTITDPVARHIVDARLFMS